MNNRIRHALFSRAIANGMGMTFADRGTHWEARWTTGTRAIAWSGTLAEVWVISEGRLP